MWYVVLRSIAIFQGYLYTQNCTVRTHQFLTNADSYCNCTSMNKLIWQSCIYCWYRLFMVPYYIIYYFLAFLLNQHEYAPHLKTRTFIKPNTNVQWWPYLYDLFHKPYQHYWRYLFFSLRLEQYIVQYLYGPVRTFNDDLNFMTYFTSLIKIVEDIIFLSTIRAIYNIIFIWLVQYCKISHKKNNSKRSSW